MSMTLRDDIEKILDQHASFYDCRDNGYDYQKLDTYETKIAIRELVEAYVEAERVKLIEEIEKEANSCGWIDATGTSHLVKDYLNKLKRGR